MRISNAVVNCPFQLFFSVPPNSKVQMPHQPPLMTALKKGQTPQILKFKYHTRKIICKHLYFLNTLPIKSLCNVNVLSINLLKYGSEEKGSSLRRCSVLLGFIMSKNLRGLWFYLLIKVQNATSLVFLT